MQNIITLNSVNAHRESCARRSATFAALYFVGMIAALIFGVWTLIAFGSRIGFYGSIAAIAALADPFRRHLTALLD